MFANSSHRADHHLQMVYIFIYIDQKDLTSMLQFRPLTELGFNLNVTTMNISCNKKIVFKTKAWKISYK